MVPEDRAPDAVSRPRKKSEIGLLEAKGRSFRSVNYSDLDREEQENVLTDLLVKSAINHALERQKQVRFYSQGLDRNCDRTFALNLLR